MFHVEHLQFEPSDTFAPSNENPLVKMNRNVPRGTSTI